MKCYLHPERPAVAALNVPCAPGGKLFVCAECNTEAGQAAVAKAYLEKHKHRTAAFKVTSGNARN
jgi:hypothetical protein